MGADRKQKIKEMRSSCISEYHDWPALDRWFYVNIGFLFTRLFVRTRITPNQITALWGMMMIVSSLLFLFESKWLHVLGAVGWILAYSLDSTDGQVARYKKIFSKRGVFLDDVNHSISWFLLPFCIGFGQYLSSGEILNAVFGTIAGMSMLLLGMVTYLYILTGPNPDKNASAEITESALKKKRRHALIRSISPFTFVNLFIVILIAASLDLMVFLTGMQNLIFTDGLFWMTSFLSMLIFACATVYLTGLIARIVKLYRKFEPRRTDIE
ncbi:MAG: CDP-alcohol phosphatidyltransferase family protein [Methanomassiliicoccaceae archaeon]|nr:CDP-alcohol phosphatidyltransferase family protein [Methanomassiliicoccaceae archaeon]